MLRALLLAGLLAAPLGACGGKQAATEPTAAPAGSAAPLAGSAVSGDPATLCTSTGGTVGNASCCGAVGDFPDMSGVGACGCAPTSSHPVKVCDCPAGKRFSATAGCR